MMHVFSLEAASYVSNGLLIYNAGTRFLEANLDKRDAEVLSAEFRPPLRCDHLAKAPPASSSLYNH